MKKNTGCSETEDVEQSWLKSGMARGLARIGAMNKLAVLVWLFQASFFLGALEVYTAPMLYIDETGGSGAARSIQEDILNALGAVETGIDLQFIRIRDSRIHPPESVMDAVEVCRVEQADYLLYGYLAERAYTYQAEIRLFEYESRQVRQVFYAMDDNAHYERLIKELTGKILAYMSDTFHLRIIQEDVEFTRILIPAAVGYWTPASSEWTRRLIGTFNITSGITVIPCDRIFVMGGFPFYLSTGLDIGYRLGVGHPGRYEAYDHNLYVNLPVILHMDLEERHRVFAGLGLIYFLDILNITQKYSDSETFVYNNMGMNISFGYRFFLKKDMVLFFRNDFALQFAGKTLFSYSPLVGLEFQVYEKELVKKW
jgi:hypothetical protein